MFASFVLGSTAVDQFPPPEYVPGLMVLALCFFIVALYHIGYHVDRSSVASCLSLCWTAHMEAELVFILDFWCGGGVG